MARSTAKRAASTIRSRTAPNRRGGTGDAARSIYTCTQPEVENRPLPGDINPRRLRLVRNNEKKWVNGTILHYYFFDKPTDGRNGSWIGAENQKRAVRRAFKEWKDIGIGLEFREASAREEAEIRIGFDHSDGSWSYVGRDVIDVATDPDERTMNFGWDLTTPYGHDTALHEIGHTLGFPHEHQNPYAGIEWDEQAVLDYFSGSPNFWPEQTTRWNILRKLSAAEVGGSAWDPNSIMHYQFPAGVIKQPAKYATGLVPTPGLSSRDIKWVKQFYPGQKKKIRELKPFESQRLEIDAGQQIDFIIRPSYSRHYRLQTVGAADTVIVLFENIDGDPEYIDGDDDSGFDRNASVNAWMRRGREYLLRVRLYYAHQSGETAIFMW